MNLSQLSLDIDVHIQSIDNRHIVRFLNTFLKLLLSCMNFSFSNNDENKSIISEHIKYSTHKNFFAYIKIYSIAIHRVAVPSEIIL
jgi:hypothetical protein